MGFDVIVIGSGFGGAVSAANLAQVGMRVCVLERRAWWGRSQGHRALPESLATLARSVNTVHAPLGRGGLTLPLSRKGLIEVHVFTRASMMNGIGVGGSSLLYGGLSQRPADDFFDAFPAEITQHEMEKHFLSIEGVLQPTPCPTRTDRSEHLEKAAPDLGMRFSVVSQAVQRGDGPEVDQIIENRFGRLRGSLPRATVAASGDAAGTPRRSGGRDREHAQDSLPITVSLGWTAESQPGTREEGLSGGRLDACLRSARGSGA